MWVCKYLSNLKYDFDGLYIFEARYIIIIFSILERFWEKPITFFNTIPTTFDKLTENCWKWTLYFLIEDIFTSSIHRLK